MANTGKQPEAYTVDSVPEGWEIQGVSNLELTIAPRDFEYDIDNLRADTRGTPEKRLREFARDPQFFVGKIVVMLRSDRPAFAPSEAG